MIMVIFSTISKLHWDAFYRSRIIFVACYFAQTPALDIISSEPTHCQTPVRVTEWAGQLKKTIVRISEVCLSKEKSKVSSLTSSNRDWRKHFVWCESTSWMTNFLFIVSSSSYLLKKYIDNSEIWPVLYVDFVLKLVSSHKATQVLRRLL